jgi:PAS domain S-box-containing protein
LAVERKKILREIVDKIGSGKDISDLKKHFVKSLGAVNPVEIDYYRDEWMKDGVKEKDIQFLLDMGTEVFRESIQNQAPIVEKGHPIYTLMKEHALLMEYANELHSLAKMLSSGEREKRPEFVERVRQLIGFVVDSESHYLREENALFPVIEKHGLTGPPAAMWNEHQDIHALEKKIFELNSESDKKLESNLEKLSTLSLDLANLLATHFNKENNILFPASLRLFSEAEWETVVQDFDDIGYCSYSIRPVGTGKITEAISEAGDVVFGSGRLSVEMLEAIFSHLPVDMTFVDAQDRVQFFSESPERIFVRSRAIIGRSVQLCHPKASVHVVEKILTDFRDRKRDSAEFWINLGGKLIHIRYFAVRDRQGEYLGCLEVSQDITEIVKIKGEKRLLDD